jgi:hypothetical protein
MQTGAGQHVDSAVQELFEILAERHDVQQRAVWVHVHQQIDVAIRADVATRDRAEYAEVARPVLRRDSEDVLTFLLQVHGGYR